MTEETASRDSLSDEEVAFLALSNDELKEKSQTCSFDFEAFEARIKSGENWVRLIQAHLYFDHVLTAMLSEALVNAEAISASRMSFAQKVQLINAMGLLPQELISPIEFMNSLRNKIAHRLEFSISDNDVRDFSNCVPRSLRDAMETLETRSLDGPLEFHELLVVLLLQVEIERQRHAYQRLAYRQGTLQLRAALIKAAPTLQSIRARESARND